MRLQHAASVFNEDVHNLKFEVHLRNFGGDFDKQLSKISASNSSASAWASSSASFSCSSLSVLPPNAPTLIVLLLMLPWAPTCVKSL